MVLTLSAPSAEARVKTFQVPKKGAGGDIVRGSDGALWFMDAQNSRIGRISSRGRVRMFKIPGADVSNALAPGPDGALWFGLGPFAGPPNALAIGRMTTDGDLTRLPVPAHAGRVAEFDPHRFSIAAGPDGAMWFTAGDAAIRRITAQGVSASQVVSTFALPPARRATSIAAGADGALWFTEPFARRLGRITVAGQVTEYKAGRFCAGESTCWPDHITAGPGRTLWFLNDMRGSGRIGRITTDGVVAGFTVRAPQFVGVTRITRGPDGAMWFTEQYPRRIGRITRSGRISHRSLPPARGDRGLGAPLGITAGPRSTLWFTAGNIGRLKP
jgi:virginiamycin B lyase